MKGSVSKRCQCEAVYNNKGKRLACKKDHGSWSYVADLGPDPRTGKRRQQRRSGMATREEAEAALAAVLNSVNEGTHTHDGRSTVSTFLASWIEAKVAKGMRPSTEGNYRRHIRDYIEPHLGRMRLCDVRSSHIEAMLRDAEKPREGRKDWGPASVVRLHATIRSALGSAKRARLVPFNAAEDMDLPNGKRPKVRPWEAWELGRFLDHAAQDRLGPLYEIMAMTGLRRGEMCGLRWPDVKTAADGRRYLIISRQLFQISGPRPCPYCDQMHKGRQFGPTKTASGAALRVDLDVESGGVLAQQEIAQAAEKAEWGSAYSDHDLVFAKEDGTPLLLDWVSKRFAQLSTEAGLRHVRLHDLRHGAASLRMAAGVDMAVISKNHGHSTLSITSDTYAHMLEGVGWAAAEKARALVPRSRCDQSVTNASDSGGSAEG